MLNFLFALVGLLAGGVINALADVLPEHGRLRPPHCPRCDYNYGPADWLALTRLIRGVRACPNCGLPARGRPLLVEVTMGALFAILPLFISPPVDLVVYAFHVAVLTLIIVTDLEHRLILHIVTLPATLLALAGSFFVSDNSPLLALTGAVAGFLLFFAAYWLGQFLFGPGALGFGDVTLSMTMGAMLGLHRIIFALVLGILLGGLVSLFLVASGRYKLRSAVAYGPFLAAAGIIMILWGIRFLDWYAQ